PMVRRRGMPRSGEGRVGRTARGSFGAGGRGPGGPSRVNEVRSYEQAWTVNRDLGSRRVRFGLHTRVHAPRARFDGGNPKPRGRRAPISFVRRWVPAPLRAAREAALEAPAAPDGGIARRGGVRHNAPQPAREAGWRARSPRPFAARERPLDGRSTHGPGVAGLPPPVPSNSRSISTKRRRQILAVLLGAFALLSAASVATFQRPGLDAEFWQSPNACGPVGAGLAWLLSWAFGHAAAFLVPLAAGVWAWNRLRDREVAPLLLRTGLGALLAFELCLLLALGGGDRWAWSGGWGLAASLALQTSMGALGLWGVAAALFVGRVLAARALGFHWIGALMHGALVRPAQGAVAAYGSWRELRAEQARVDAKQRARDEKETRRRPAKAAGAVA